MKRRTDAELIGQAKALHNQIFFEDVYATHDLLEYDALCAELEQRGYEAVETLSFVKREEP